MKLRIINLVKNLLLVLLTLLMAALMVVIWFRTLSWEDIPVDSRFGQFYMRMAYGSASTFALRTEQTPAAYPIEIAVRCGRRMVGAQNDESGVDALYEQYQEVIREALSAAHGAAEAGDEDAFLKALAGDCIFFRYHSALPVNLLFQWLAGTQDAPRDASVSAFLIAEDGTVWMRDSENGLLCFSADVDAAGWGKRLEDTIFQDCAFLGSRAAQSGLLPETLIFETRRQAFSAMETGTPAYLENNGVDSLQTVLEAFEYNAAVGNYMDGETRIFVNNNSTLRVGADGKIAFRATSMTGGIEAYREGEATEEGELSLRVGVAQSVIEQIQKSYTTDASVYLCAVHQDEATGRFRMQFRYLCNGVPVMGEIGRCATVEFLQNTLVSAEISARTFLASEELHYLVPCAQVLEMAGAEDVRVPIGYFEEDGVLRPRRYFEQAELR